MTRRIAVGAGLLLTLGTAVAGTFMYGGQAREPDQGLNLYEPQTQPQQVTPEMIAMWKATAASTDYIAPKVPI